MPLLKLKYKPASNPCATGYSPSEVEYVGHVVPLKFLSKNEFALTTGDYVSPVRILDKSSIIKAWVDRSNRPDNVTIVEGKYVVTSGPFNRYSCTCTAYKYRNKCSHADGVKHGRAC
ncbi:hypothetical protein EB001_19945 [bacterium]|nr:hypothetical protein [bacterium]